MKKFLLFVIIISATEISKAQWQPTNATTTPISYYGNVGIRVNNATYPLTIYGQGDSGNSGFAILGSSTNSPMIELLQRGDGTTNGTGTQDGGRSSAPKK